MIIATCGTADCSKRLVEDTSRIESHPQFDPVSVSIVSKAAGIMRREGVMSTLSPYFPSKPFWQK